MNVFQPIWNNANIFGDRVALVSQGRDITYAQLVRSATLACARLSEAGVSSGDVIALSLASPLAYIIAALGVARLGGIVLPLNITEPQAVPLMARHRAHTLVRDHSEDWRHPGLPNCQYLTANEVMAPPEKGQPLPVVPPIAKDVGRLPWMISLSSGTTGTPKSIPHTHDRSVLNSILPISRRPMEGARVLVFAGYFISMSMNAVLRDLFAGNTVILTPTRTPEEFFSTVERDRPTHVVTSTGTAVQLLAHAQSHRPDSLAACSSIQGMTLAGSAVSSALRTGLEGAICPRIEINYGSSEAGGMALATPETLAARPDSAGRVHAWVEMEAVDAGGRPLAPGKAGILRLKTPLLVEGYLDDPAATAAAFKDGWFYPGDTGMVDPAGYLTLTGRADELLNLGGNKVDPFLIEGVLDAQPGVRECVVVPLEGRAGVPVLIALVVADNGFDEEALKKACVEQLGQRYSLARVVQTPSIPRNAGGKIMRREIAAKLKAKAGEVSGGSGS